MVPKSSANGNGSGRVPISPAIMCERLVSAEMAERRIKREQAESEVSVRARLAPSAITNFRKGRIKDVEKLGTRIEAAFIAFLERQIARLEYELAVARMARREVDLGAAEAAILAAKEALGRAPASGQNHDYGAVDE